jgi:hypothetical protein
MCKALCLVAMLFAGYASAGVVIIQPFGSANSLVSGQVTINGMPVTNGTSIWLAEVQSSLSNSVMDIAALAAPTVIDDIVTRENLLTSRLREIRAIFSGLSSLANPTVDTMVTRINTILSKLQEIRPNFSDIAPLSAPTMDDLVPKENEILARIKTVGL